MLAHMNATIASIATLARLGGSLLVLFFAGFVLADGFTGNLPNPITLSNHQRFYALGLCALYGGLAVAWYRASWGGILSLIGSVLVATVSRRMPLEWPLALPAALGVVHLTCAIVLGGDPPALRPTWAKATLYGVAGVLAVLFGSEMFGNPPLLASARAIPQLAGSWSDDYTNMTISDDGTVNGTIGHSRIASASLRRNRSWLGRLLNWRTDYRVAGTLAGGEDFILLVNANRDALTGTVEVGRRPGHSRVHLRRQ